MILIAGRNFKLYPDTYFHWPHTGHLWAL